MRVLQLEPPTLHRPCDASPRNSTIFSALFDSNLLQQMRLFLSACSGPIVSLDIGVREAVLLSNHDLIIQVIALVVAVQVHCLVFMFVFRLSVAMATSSVVDQMTAYISKL